MSRVLPERTSATDGDDEVRYVESNEDGRAVVVSFIATLFAVKILTSILILIVFPSVDAALVICALSVPWFIGAGWYFGVAGRLRLRLMRVRARRRRLIYEEWNVD
jgi:hypothetical protein